MNVAVYRTAMATTMSKSAFFLLDGCITSRSRPSGPMTVWSTAERELCVEDRRALVRRTPGFSGLPGFCGGAPAFPFDVAGATLKAEVQRARSEARGATGFTLGCAGAERCVSTIRGICVASQQVNRQDAGRHTCD